MSSPVFAIALLIVPPHLPAADRFDDFEDGDLGDCNPLCWKLGVHWFPGGHTLRDGLLEMWSVDFRPYAMAMAPSESFAGDVSVRTQAYTLNPGSSFAVFAHSVTDPFSFDAMYIAVFGDAPDAEGGIALWFCGPATCRVLRSRGLPRQDFPPEEDHLLQLDVKETAEGNLLEAWIWKPGEAKPAEPMVSYLDPNRLVVAEGAGIDVNGRAAFEDFWVFTGPRFLRGDCNGDGEVNLADASCVLNWLFAGADQPGCLAAINNNGDGAIDIADPVFLLNFLFAGGPRLSAPFPDCGPCMSPADEQLGCANTPVCQ